MSIGSLKADTHQPVPLFGIGKKARSTFLSSVRKLNCIVESNEGGRQPVAIIGLPGLQRYASVGAAPARGIFARAVAEEIYVVSGDELYRIRPGQIPVSIATLHTLHGPVWMDENGEQLFINDGVQAKIYTYATQTVVNVTDIDYPSGARGGVNLNGRFHVYVTTGPNAGRVYASDVYNGLSWNGLNFITPESRPTGIIALYRWFDDLIVIGNKTIEWWSYASVSIPGALGLQPSANANTAIGGVSERGISNAGQRLFFVGHEQGPVGIYEISGYSIHKVSTAEIDLKLGLAGGIHAMCTGYAVTDHTLLQVTSPSTSPINGATWVYDTTTDEWSDRGSYRQPYYRGLFASESRGKTYITDAFSNALYVMDNDTYDEDGDILEFEVSSAHILKGGDYLTIQKIQVDMETGVGNTLPPGDDPHGILCVSKDGGNTWPIERHVSLGKVGQYAHRAQAYRFGTARDIVVKWRITDPVPRRLTGAYLVMEPGTA